MVQKTTKKWLSQWEKCKFLDFLKKKKKVKKNTFFWSPPINETFFKKHKKWALASKKSTFSGSKKKWVKVVVHGFFPKMAIFERMPMLTTPKKTQKMKNVKKIFSSTEKFWLKTLFWKNVTKKYFFGNFSVKIWHNFFLEKHDQKIILGEF